MGEDEPDPRDHQSAATGAPEAPGPTTPRSPCAPFGTRPQSPDWNLSKPQQNYPELRDFEVSPDFGDLPRIF